MRAVRGDPRGSLRQADLITIDEAASPHSSLAFMFWGEGLFVVPLMLLYTAISYSVFRGKAASFFAALLEQGRSMPDVASTNLLGPWIDEAE